MKRLEGKVAVITGGNSGIGLATAQRFVDEGAYVFITGRRQSELDAAVKQIGKKTSPVFRVTSQISQILIGCMTRSRQQKGRIDVLFANAGIIELAPLGSITESHFDKIFNINVKGLLFTVQKALPLFQDGGSIILTASIRFIQRVRDVNCLQCNQGRNTVICSHMDGRSETPQDPRQRHQPWPDRHTHLQ